MSLSRKNLGKLKNFIKENNLVNNNSSKNPQKSHNSLKVDDPSKIFYSIIDNSNNINDTSKENSLLKKSEDSIHNTNSRFNRQSIIGISVVDNPIRNGYKNTFLRS